MVARGARGAALEAARAWSKGERQHALAILRAPDLMNDAQAVHLRAQLLDELSTGLLPLYRLGVVRLYREALLLDRDSPAAGRARVRSAQILLELGLVPEARAELAPHLDALSGSDSVAGLVTLAEITYRGGDPTRAIELMARLDLQALPLEMRAWELERRADSFFALRRFSEALDLYAARFDLAAAPAPDPRAAARFAFALLLHGRGPEALARLASALEHAPLAEPPLEALLRLVQARALRETAAYSEAVRAAAAVPPLWPGSEVAALGAVEALESARLSGSEALALPPGTAEMVQPTSAIPALALLSYRVASRPAPGDGPRSSIDRIGRVLVGVRPGPLQLLAQEDLTHRLSPELERWALGKAAPDPGLLDVVENYLRPHLMGESELLLAVESLSRDARRSTCVRWSQILQQRERRPLRRGVAAWRRAQCLGAPRGDGNTAQRLLADADSGESGPFALALAALAAENELRAGRAQAAIDGYARALTALAEPRLVGPVLLRSGELQVDLGRPSLALRDLLRGMAQTERLERDPLRKAGLLALLRLARASHGAQGLPELLEREARHADEWWGPAWAYFARSQGLRMDTPAGDAPFARAARELDAIDALAGRVRERAGKRALEIPTGEALTEAIEAAAAASAQEDGVQ
jgi:tetratricopeptide (TPR) repeat protein